MKPQSKTIELFLTVLGLVALTALALSLSVLEQRQQEGETQEEQRLLEVVSDRQLLFEGYEDYRLFEPDQVSFYSQTFESGILSEWQEEIPSETELVVTEMRLHEFDGRIRFMTLIETSPSGDWVRESEYYYTAQGNLGVLVSRLNTFYGNVSVEEERIYLEGMLIEQTKNIFDLTTDETVDRSYQDQPIQVFLTIADIELALGNSVLQQEQ